MCRRVLELRRNSIQGEPRQPPRTNLGTLVLKKTCLWRHLSGLPAMDAAGSRQMDAPARAFGYLMPFIRYRDEFRPGRQALFVLLDRLPRLARS